MVNELGIWIHDGKKALFHLHEIKKLGFDYILFKTGDGESAYNERTRGAIITDAENVINYYEWAYVYPNLKYQSQLNNLNTTYNVLDMESEWGGELKESFIIEDVIRSNTNPKHKFALSSFYSIALHQEFPWDILRAVDIFMPQVYKEGKTPIALILRRLHDTVARAIDINPNLTIIPTVNTPDLLSPAIAATGRKGANIWLWDGSGSSNSEIITPGNDPGVMGLESHWTKAISDAREILESSK